MERERKENRTILTNAVKYPHTARMMTLTGQLLTVARAYCRARNLSIARVSTLVFNDGKKLDLIAQGADLGTRGLERAMRWFSAEWPENAAWPDGIERPKVKRPERAA